MVMKEHRKLVSLLMVVVIMASMLKFSNGMSLCNMNEDGLDACKPSVTQPYPAKPSTECCKALTGADLQCLCSYKNSAELPLLGIDPTLAASLPKECDLTPPSNC
ncbi:putative bifunctional inhibitor/plant lipid transfer protein/seed storage helical [Medicago truncatula]|uniref:Nodule Cysteine-Rich (NCR) secreted peptide n=1 Tax=Medicago truncatula TaxID=3880 RepID=G7KZ18_MEDTR|nr:putative lipid-transfer protein DIR1 [Medicago truncatula]AES79022.1 Nodule Cysteine-Rich (NCR) secreted peptide [Medicago truncatula]AFK43469.1 unknown [Medicago truncatula]RHN45719.1 putative bifunctional inhibitor/plant lipid transfer protein/seed storage helical [Medicago truncatula]